MTNCTCANSLKNLGLPSCVEYIKYAQHFILVPLNDDAGVANKIASGATVNDAYITARLNDTDASQRWFIIKGVKNAITAERADDVVESFDDGTQLFIEEGVATTSFIVATGTPTFVGRLKSHRCTKMGFFYVDKDGRLVGRSDGTGDLYPIAIEPETLSVKPAYATPTSAYNIPVTYKWRKDMADEDIGYWDNTVTWSSPTIGSLNDVYGTVVAGSISTTGFTIDLFYAYGAVNSKQPIKSLLIGDVSLYNETDSLAVTISTFTESATIPGRYAVTFAAQTSADVLHMSGSKTGFDFTTLESTQVTIP